MWIVRTDSSPTRIQYPGQSSRGTGLCSRHGWGKFFRYSLHTDISNLTIYRASNWRNENFGWSSEIMGHTQLASGRYPTWPLGIWWAKGIASTKYCITNERVVDEDARTILFDERDVFEIVGAACKDWYTVAKSDRCDEEISCGWITIGVLKIGKIDWTPNWTFTMELNQIKPRESLYRSLQRSIFLESEQLILTIIFSSQESATLVYQTFFPPLSFPPLPFLRLCDRPRYSQLCKRWQI